MRATALKMFVISAALFGSLLIASMDTGQQKDSGMKTATGTFDLKLLPRDAEDNASFTRMRFDKTFEGGLAGKSLVEMMATGDGSSSSGGYVALERFRGKLDGKSGSFVMQHSGLMAPGFMEVTVVISPGSGTEELVGIRGTLEIRKEGKQHFYTLSYKLPE